MTFKTRGIVLRYVKYGESSIIVTILTELFGIQVYMVKGVRQKTTRNTNKLVFFQPGAVLELVVHKNPHKNLQYIRDYEWHRIHSQLFYDIHRNAILTYCIELLNNYFKEPEIDIAFFEETLDFIEQIDKAQTDRIANIPIKYTINFLKNIGIGLSDELELLHQDLIPLVIYSEDNSTAFADIRAIHSIMSEEEWSHVKLNGRQRIHLLHMLQNYLQGHIPDVKPIRSLDVLSQVLR